MHAVSVFSGNNLNAWVINLVFHDCLAIVCYAFAFSDWDGIMERDNHQEGEADGVKICGPTSDGNPPGKSCQRSVQLF